LRGFTRDITFDSLRHQAATISQCLGFQFRIDVIDREPSAAIEKSGTWSRGIINQFNR
jgi:hypothetical protein